MARYRFYMLPPAVIWQGQVNQVQFEHSIGQVTWDTEISGSWQSLMQEMMLCVGSTPGADDYGRGRIRLTANANTVYFGWASAFRGEGALWFRNNAYLTVTDLFRPWAKSPRILNDGTIYMDYDRPFAPSPPVVNLGHGFVLQADAVEGVATFAIDASTSYVTDASASSIVDWYAALPTGGVLTSGSLDSGTFSFTLPDGTWGWVLVTAVDDNGAAATRWVLCIAGEPDGMLIEAWDNLTLERVTESGPSGGSGQTLSLRINQPIPASTYPNGTVGVLVEPAQTGAARVKFAGWHVPTQRDGRATDRGYISETELTFEDVGGWLARLPAYPMVIERESSPAEWTEMEGANIDRAVHRILSELTNILTFADFTWSGLGETYYPVPGLSPQGGTAYEMAQWCANAIRHKVTCDKAGRLAMRPDPQLQDHPTENVPLVTPVTRTTTVQADIPESAWEQMGDAETFLPDLHWLHGEGIMAQATDLDDVGRVLALFCVAPGKAPAATGGEQTVGQQLVYSQAELNAAIGHWYARLTSPYKPKTIRLLPYTVDIDPAAQTWVTLTRSAATAGERPGVETAQRHLPTRYTMTYDPESDTQDETVTLERETIGQPAETVIKEDILWLNAYAPPPLPDWLPPFGPEIWNLNKGVKDLIRVHRDGTLALTTNFTTPRASGGPTWYPVDLELGEDVVSALSDPWSPLYFSGGSTVNLRLATPSRLLLVEDARGVVSRSITTQHTFAAASDQRALQMGRRLSGFAVCGSYYPASGTKAAYTSNGASWSEVTVSSETRALSGGGGGGDFDPSDYDWAHVWNFVEDDPRDTGWVFVAHDGYAPSWVPGTGVRFAIWSFLSYRYHRGEMQLITHSIPGTTTVKRLILRGVPSTSGYDPVPQGDYWRLSGDLLVSYVDWTTTPGWRASGGEVAHTAPYETTTGTLGIVIKLNYTIPGTPPPSAIPEVFTSFILAGDGEDPWPDADVPGSEVGEASGQTPAVHVSGRHNAVATVGAYVDNSGTAEGRAHDTANYGAAWGVRSPAVDFGARLGGCYHVPWHDNADESLFYYGYDDGTNYHLMRHNAGGTVDDLSPSDGGVTYGPAHERCITSCTQDRRVMAFALTRQDTGETGVWVSTDGGTTLTRIVADRPAESAYVGVHIPDDPEVLYLWGPGGVAFSADGGLTIDDRTGSVLGDVIAIAGG